MDFNIEPRFSEEFNAQFSNLQPVAQRAIERWESVITGDLRDVEGETITTISTDPLSVEIVSTDDIQIDFGLFTETEYEVFEDSGFTDRESLPVAVANVHLNGTRDENGLPFAGFVRINPDFENIPTEEEFENIFVHEIGHALGFNDFDLGEAGLVEDLGEVGKIPQYVGEQGVAAYNRIFGEDVESIPFENGGHWSEQVLGNEILTSDGDEILSEVTIGVLADLGYEVDFDAADSESPTLEDSDTSLLPLSSTLSSEQIETSSAVFAYMPDTLTGANEGGDAAVVQNDTLVEDLSYENVLSGEQNSEAGTFTSFYGDIDLTVPSSSSGLSDVYGGNELLIQDDQSSSLLTSENVNAEISFI